MKISAAVNVEMLRSTGSSEKDVQRFARQAAREARAACTAAQREARDTVR